MVMSVVVVCHNPTLTLNMFHVRLLALLYFCRWWWHPTQTLLLNVSVGNVGVYHPTLTLLLMFNCQLLVSLYSTLTQSGNITVFRFNIARY